MLTIGCLMLMFPLYVQGFAKGEFKFLQTEHLYYYHDCIEAANELLSQEDNKELKKFIRSRGKSHAVLAQSKGTTDYEMQKTERSIPILTMFYLRIPILRVSP